MKPEAENFVENSSAMVELLNKLNAGVDWAVIQSNALAADILAWGTTCATFWMYSAIFCGLICLTLLVCTFIFQGREPWPAVGAISLFFMILCILIALGNYHELLKISSAPRLYVTEELVRMLRDAGGG